MTIGTFLGGALAALCLYAASWQTAWSAAEPPGTGPNLEALAALVAAGGGRRDFRVTTLVDVLAGENANAEVAELTKRYGAANVKQTVAVIDFGIADWQRFASQRSVALPLTPLPDPIDGKALFAVLYAAGITSPARTFAIDTMLDRLMSHSVSVRVRRDVVTTYGSRADLRARAMLQFVLTDLHSAAARAQ